MRYETEYSDWFNDHWEDVADALKEELGREPTEAEIDEACLSDFQNLADSRGDVLCDLEREDKRR